jgi:pimeloyl-ACP methyl ester carboxylesterase
MHLGPRVQEVCTPTLYVWGSDDVAVGSTAALATEAWVSGPYRFEMLTDVSHWIPEEAPSELNRLLLEHLAGQPR